MSLSKALTSYLTDPPPHLMVGANEDVRYTQGALTGESTTESVFFQGAGGGRGGCCCSIMIKAIFENSSRNVDELQTHRPLAANVAPPQTFMVPHQRRSKPPWNQTCGHAQIAVPPSCTAHPPIHQNPCGSPSTLTLT